jgi:hypothetical protein
MVHWCATSASNVITSCLPSQLENLGEMHLPSITKHHEIVSAALDGPIAFISADDIAQAAYDAFFSSDKAWVRGREPLVLGPELLSYDQVRLADPNRVTFY